MCSMTAATPEAVGAGTKARKVRCSDYKNPGTLPSEVWGVSGIAALGITCAKARPAIIKAAIEADDGDHKPGRSFMVGGYTWTLTGGEGNGASGGEYTLTGIRGRIRIGGTWWF
jgi:hypothetical protein